MRQRPVPGRSGKACAECGRHWIPSQRKGSADAFIKKRGMEIGAWRGEVDRSQP